MSGFAEAAAAEPDEGANVSAAVLLPVSACKFRPLASTAANPNPKALFNVQARLSRATAGPLTAESTANSAGSRIPCWCSLSGASFAPFAPSHAHLSQSF